MSPFYEAQKPRARWRVGTEAEKFGVHTRDASPLAFEGEHGVAAVFDHLAAAHGWSPQREYQGGAVISLRRMDGSITLEPGAQLELSGAPLETVHETSAEFRAHMDELRRVSDELGVAWLGLGFQPFARQADLPWVPKLRYGVMRDYLPTRGSMALDMMRRTATVQANFDYASEQDAVRKLRVALRLSPIVTAMFANSPFVEGRATGERSRRTRVWLDTDPDRCGLLPFAWEKDMSYRRYVEWALDVPMFMIRRAERTLSNTGQTFRAFMRDGFEGAVATLADWETHLNTLFPEVRLKRTLEVRGADAQGTRLLCALPALWKGLLYDPRALAQAEALVEDLSHAQARACRLEVAADGLGARLAGRVMGEWASEVLALAEAGLTRLGHLDAGGRDETIHLAELRRLTSTGRTPADALLERIDPSRSLPGQVMQLARL